MTFEINFVTCAAQLHSKEDATRDIAANGCLNLARQCSDPTAVEKLVKLLFAVLNGKYLYMLKFT